MMHQVEHSAFCFSSLSSHQVLCNLHYIATARTLTTTSQSWTIDWSVVVFISRLNKHLGLCWLRNLCLLENLQYYLEIWNLDAAIWLFKDLIILLVYVYDSSKKVLPSKMYVQWLLTLGPFAVFSLYMLWSLQLQASGCNGSLIKKSKKVLLRGY